MKMTRLLALSAVTASVLFTGCGDVLGQEEDKQEPIKISGEVMDGYLKNATVCIDLNKNKKCDTDESSTTTGAGGKYTFEVGALDYEEYPLVVEVKSGETIDEDTGGVVAHNYVLSTPAGKHEVISPLTTMIQAQIEANPGTSSDLAEYQIKQNLGISASASLYDNYIEKEKTDTTGEYTKARVIAVAVATQLGETVALMEANGVTDTTLAAAAAMSSIVGKSEEISQIAESVVANQGTTTPIDYSTIGSTVGTALNDANLSEEINNQFKDFDPVAYQDELNSKLDVIASQIDDPNIMKNLLEGNGYFETHIYVDMMNPEYSEIGYQKIHLSDDKAKLLFDSYYFDFNDGTWKLYTEDMMQEDQNQYKEIILSDTGWVEQAESNGGNSGEMDVTFNPDGSMDVTDDYGKTHVSVAAAYNVGNKKFINYLWNLPPETEGVFSEGARAFQLAFSGEEMQQDTYRLHWWPEYICDYDYNSTTYGSCNEDYTQNGNHLRYWDQNDQQEHNVTTISELLTLFAYETNASGDITNDKTLWGSGFWNAEAGEWIDFDFQLGEGTTSGTLYAVQREWIQEEVTKTDCWTSYDFNGTDTVEVEECNDYTYWEGRDEFTQLPQTGTWNIETVNGVEILVLHKPDAYKDEWENWETIYAVNNGVVMEGNVDRYVEGDKYAEVNSNYGFNETAMTDIKELVAAEYAKMSGTMPTAMSTKSRTSATARNVKVSPEAQARARYLQQKNKANR